MISIHCASQFELSQENLSSGLRTINNSSRAQGYKTFFMLNSAEHEIYPAHKFGILTFISGFCDLNMGMNFIYFGYFSIYEQFKFQAHLS